MKRTRENEKEHTTTRKEKGHKHKGRKTKKNEKSSSRDQESVSNISDTDFDDETLELLPKEYKPIWSFIDDRKEMLEQIFTSIDESTLQKLLPKELKAYDIKQIKTMCLEQLNPMSEDNILYILAGGDPKSFVEKKSEADLTTSSSADIQSQGSTLGSKEIQDKNEESTMNVAEKRSQSAGASSDTLELHPNPSDVANLNEDSVVSLLSQADANTDLELLELEMRAKAIRSLLQDDHLPELSDDDEDEEVMVISENLPTCKENRDPS